MTNSVKVHPSRLLQSNIRWNTTNGKEIDHTQKIIAIIAGTNMYPSSMIYDINHILF